MIESFDNTDYPSGFWQASLRPGHVLKLSASVYNENMKLFNETRLPNAVVAWLVPVLSRFALFDDAESVSVLHYYVTTIGGDTSFVVLQYEEVIYVLVTTDHPDPYYDRKKLEELSQDKYSFVELITPTNGSITLDDFDVDTLPADFFIRDKAIYFYLAKAKLRFENSALSNRSRK